MARTRLLAVLSAGIGFLVPLLVAEALLRLLPVRTGLRTRPVNATNPARRFAPNRTFIFSRDWNFSLVNKGRTNNLGFVNDQDYDSASNAPLLAVIGDSYVEAPMVPFAETMQGRPAQRVPRRSRLRATHVPPGGRPGTRRRERLRPKPQPVQPGPGLHLFTRDSTGLVLELEDYRPSLYRRIVRHSALARYVILNLAGGVDKARKFLLGRETKAATFVGKTEASYSSERLRDSRAAVDEFLKQAPGRSGLQPGTSS